MARSLRRRARLGYSGFQAPRRRTGPATAVRSRLGLCTTFILVIVSATHLTALEVSNVSPGARHQVEDLAAPRPLPDNPPPEYPDPALGATVDGDVVFVAHVTAEGHVASVRFLEVPEEGVGFEGAVREAVLQWQFEAARTNGVPRLGTYVGKVTFTQRLPYAHARMYSRSSQDVWQEALEVVGALGHAEDVTDVESQILVTQWVRFDAALFGQPPPESAGPGQGLPQEFELHVFVSPFVEPARVHVGSVSVGLGNVRYNLGVAEQWFFRALERRLGERGQAIPTDARTHRWVASQLLGVPDSCLDSSPTDGTAQQTPTSLTVVPAISARPLSADSVVALEVVVSLDGAVTASRAVEVAESDTDGMVVAAATGAVSLWRYRPARSEECPVPFTGTANVIFPAAANNAGVVYTPDDEGIEIPKPVQMVDPDYTEAAMRAQIQGEIWLEVVVLPAGTVGEVTITKSLDRLFGLNDEAIKAARQWLWSPGTRFGEPVPVRVPIAIEFRLRDPPQQGVT